jgi:hypothetical protein
MNKLFYVLLFLGSPAFSAGLEIQLAGEGVQGTVKN